MKKINMIIVAFILMFAFSIVNAETISVNKISNDDLKYNFDVKINHVLNENNINVVKGIIYYDSDLISNIELVNSGDWKVKYLLENDKVSFITYIIGDFAVSNDSLFNININVNENLEEDKVELVINDLMTTNGDNIFIFNKMEYKFENLDALIETESEEIGVGQLNSWFDKIIEEIKNKDSIVNNNSELNSVVQNSGSSSVDKDDSIVENNKDDVSEDELIVPDQDISNKVELKNNTNTGLIVVIGFVFVLFVMVLIFNYVLYKVIMKNINEVKGMIKELKNDEDKTDELVKKTIKEKKKKISSKKIAKKGDK